MFATYPSKANYGYDKVLLVISPIGQEDSLGAKAHFNYIKFVLNMFRKFFQNVCVLIGDNCATKISLAKKVHDEFSQCYFIGCASHRFNLAVVNIILKYNTKIQKMNTLIKKLQNLVPAAKLRRLRHLRALTANKTRWSSTFSMISRYRQIAKFIRKINDYEILDMIPDNRQNSDIEKLYDLLNDLDSVTKHFQSDNATILNMRAIIHNVLSRHQSATNRLSENSSIVFH